MKIENITEEAKQIIFTKYSTKYTKELFSAFNTCGYTEEINNIINNLLEKLTQCDKNQDNAILNAVRSILAFANKLIITMTVLTLHFHAKKTIAELHEMKFENMSELKDCYLSYILQTEYGQEIMNSAEKITIHIDESGHKFKPTIH